MNIRFLGTCFGSLKTKKKNVKDYRRPASLLVDDSILIDITEQTLPFADDFGLSDLYRGVHTVLITTADSERFCADALYALASIAKKLDVYASADALEKITPHPSITPHEVKPNEIFDAQGAKIIALPTVYSSDAGAKAIGYALCTNRSLLYLPDGGFLHPDAWMLLKKLHFDHAILGCPTADLPIGAQTVTASNFELAKILRAVFVDAGMLSCNARCFLTAIPTDKKRSVHEALLQLAKDEGFTVAYDGLYMNV